MSLVIWRYTRGNVKKNKNSKDKRTLLKVVWGYSLSLTSTICHIAKREKGLQSLITSTICHIAKREKGLQSLSPHFDRVSVSKKMRSLAIEG